MRVIEVSPHLLKGAFTPTLTTFPASQASDLTRSPINERGAPRITRSGKQAEAEGAEGARQTSASSGALVASKHRLAMAQGCHSHMAPVSGCMWGAGATHTWRQ